MNNAYKLAEIELGSADDWVITGSTSRIYFDTYLKRFLKTTKIEDETGSVERFNYSTIVYLDDGTKLYLQDFGADGFMRVLFDLNGDAKPNITGRDLFQFWHIPRGQCYRFRDCGKFTAYYPFGQDDFSRTRMMQLCERPAEKGFYCAQLLMHDGWEFKDDYPHRL